MPVHPDNKEIPKRYKMSQRGTSCANLYAAAVRNDRRVFAFTLAEVLITLVIIGVIAALTIPNLMQSWRKHERITQIKTAYSIIQNAIKLSIAENGNPDGWDFEWGPDAAKKYILPYLKIQYECGSGTMQKDVLSKGCFKDNNRNGTWYYLNGDLGDGGTGYGPTYYYTVKLQNGMDLGIWATERKNQGNHAYRGKRIDFAFDVNGAQGPTKAGVDVFVLSVYPNNNKVVTGSPWNMQASTNWQAMLTTTYNAGCGLNANDFSGMGCARVIELNGWNFPDNYPVKKF